MTWLAYACGAALFAGITPVLAKAGIKKTDSNLAAAIRTLIIFLFACFMVKITGSSQPLSSIGQKSMLFLLFSGFVFGASCLCHFKALQLGDVNQAVPVDKAVPVLAMLLAVPILHKTLNVNQVISIVLIFAGILMMIVRNGKSSGEKSHTWLLFAILSAVLAGVALILAEFGLREVNPYLTAAVFTGVVLVMAWIAAIAAGGIGKIRSMPFIDGIFLCLSGVAAGLAGLCYYRAISLGQDSAVAAVQRLSILITVLFACAFLHEKLYAKAAAGLILLICGMLLLLVETPVLALFGL